MLGNRKAFKQALAAYLCIGGILGICLAFYGTTWDRWINTGWLIAVLAAWALGSLAAIVLAWKRIKKEEPPGPLYLHNLLPKNVRRWILGNRDLHSGR